MPARLTSLAWSLHQKGVCTSRGPKCQLIKGKALSSSFQNSSPSTSCKSKSTDREFGHFQQSCVISDSANNHTDFAITTRLLHTTHNSCQRNWRTIGLAHTH